MDVVTIRGRNGQPFNVDRLYVGGVDIGSLLAQLNGINNMSTAASIVTTTERYVATTAGVGYSIGHILRRTELIDISTTPPIASVYWYNFSTGSSLTVNPDTSGLTLQSQTGLTDSELRASPITIRMDPTSPDIIRLGNLTDDLASVDGTGAVTVIGALKRLISTSTSISSRLPGSLGQKVAANSIPVVINSDTWEGAGYTINDTTGNLVQERQTNGSQTRTREWTTITDAGGNAIQTPGPWVYQ